MTEGIEVERGSGLTGKLYLFFEASVNILLFKREPKTYLYVKDRRKNTVQHDRYLDVK